MIKISVQQRQVPETSYSSSEGEDDFYDANDDPFSSQVTTPTRWVQKIVQFDFYADIFFRFMYISI